MQLERVDGVERVELLDAAFFRALAVVALLLGLLLEVARGLVDFGQLAGLRVEVELRDEELGVVEQLARDVFLLAVGW